MTTGVGGGFFQSIGIGAVSGAVTSGIGKVFEIGKAATLGAKVSTEFGRGFFHGMVQGGLSALGGDDFLSGFASGTLGSWATSGFQHTFIGSTKAGMLAFGALSGGIGAAATGGNFWKGMGQGLITTGLNHAAHSIFEGSTHLFDSQEEAYEYMNKSSLKKGKPYKEHFAYDLEDGKVLLMKRTRNQVNRAITCEDNLSRQNGKVYYKGWFKRYAVVGSTHTHPTLPNIQYPNLGISTNDMEFAAKWPELRHQIIYKNNLYQIWQNGNYQLIGALR